MHAQPATLTSYGTREIEIATDRARIIVRATRVEATSTAQRAAAMLAYVRAVRGAGCGVKH